MWLLIKGDVIGTVENTLFLGLSFAYFLRDKPRPTIFDLLFTLAALLSALGSVFDLFDQVVLYDKLMHAFMSFAVSLAFYFLFYTPPSPRKRSITLLTSVFTLGVCFGTLWEIFEWATGNNYGYLDTISDLAIDSASALAASLVALVIYQRGRQIT